MAYVRIDTLFMDRTGVASLSDAAFRLHIEAILYNARFDLEVIPPHVVRHLANRTRTSWKKRVAELEAAGLWDCLPDGWRLSNEHRPRTESRPSIPRATRELVFRRDGHACVICGAEERLSLDHVIPFAFGGSDRPDNLRTLCHRCNSLRGAGRLTDDELREIANER